MSSSPDGSQLEGSSSTIPSANTASIFATPSEINSSTTETVTSRIDPTSSMDLSSPNLAASGESIKMCRPSGFAAVWGSEFVELTVGSSKEVFKVHRQRLCNRVPYFSKMLLGNFPEARKSAATFPEDDAEMFGLLLNWVYDGSIPTLEWSNDSEGLFAPSWHPLSLYTLADKYNITEVMDRVFDLYFLSLKTKDFGISSDDFDSAYTSTLEGSPLRRYASHFLAHSLLANKYEHLYTDEWIQALFSKYPNLAQDIVPRIRGNSLSPLQDRKRDLPSCEYHVHPKTMTGICPWNNGIGNNKRKAGEMEE